MLTVMSVSLFDNEPGECPEGHFLGPGLVTVGWMPCNCGPARAVAEQGRGLGHRYTVCRQCEARGVQTWMYHPPHDPGIPDRV
jgi:hypothetical protein